MLKINASDLSRIMYCGGSVGLGVLTPSLDAPDDHKIEGLAAHAVIQNVLNGTTENCFELIGQTYHGHIVTADMIDFLEPHIEFIKKMSIEHNAPLEIEVPLDWSTEHVFIGARCDVVSYSHDNKILYIEDFKFGWKIVEPKMNWAMISYAIGYCINRKIEPKLIMMKIHQPRPFHPDGSIRKWCISFSELLEFYQQIQNRFANLPTDLSTGAHCYKCPSAAYCPAARMSSLSCVDVSVDGYHEDLTNTQISYELDLLSAAQDAIKVRLDALKSLAENNIRKGQQIENYGLENSIGNYQWNEGTTPELLSLMVGISVEKLVESTIVSPSKAKKVGANKDTINSLCFRPSRGFRLVRQNIGKKAKKIFDN